MTQTRFSFDVERNVKSRTLRPKYGTQHCTNPGCTARNVWWSCI